MLVPAQLVDALCWHLLSHCLSPAVLFVCRPPLSVAHPVHAPALVVISLLLVTILLLALPPLSLAQAPLQRVAPPIHAPAREQQGGQGHHPNTLPQPHREGAGVYGRMQVGGW